MLRRLKLMTLAFILGQVALMPRASACAKQGLCDLSEVNWDAERIIQISGDWNFYWNQLLSPQDIEQGRGQPLGFLAPEVELTGTELGGVALSSSGHMTYSVDFLIKNARPLTLQLPELPAAARIWLNGEEIASFGTLARDGKQAEEQARMQIFFHNFQPREGTNTLTIAMSNYSYIFHGANAGVQIGLNHFIYQDYLTSATKDGLVFGALLIISFYHFYLWWIRKSRLAPLYFGLFCFAIGARSLVSGRGELLCYFFSQTPLELQIKIEYLGFTTAFASVNLLVNVLYPQEYRKYISHPITILSTLWLLIILVTTANIYPQAIPFFQGLIILAGTLVIITLALAMHRRREGAGIFLMGFCVFFAGGVNDVLLAKNIIDTFPAVHLGTFGFVFFQAILLSKRFDHAFDQSEQAEKKIRQLNEGLEQKVKERTDQINTILNNVSSGFLLIDRAGRLLPGFTASCRQLLGIEMQDGQLLVESLPIKENTRNSFKMAVMQVFEDLMPPEVSLTQLPARVRLRDHTLGISGAALRDSETGLIKAILFTINDVTNLQDAEHEVQHNKMLLGIIQEKESFKLFLKDYKEELHSARQAAENNQQTKVRSFLHTMKGNLSAFGIHEIVLKIHEIEGTDRISLEDINIMANMIDLLLADNSKLLGLGSFETSHYELSHDDYQGLLSYINGHVHAAERSQLITLVKNSCQKSVRSYIGPLQNSAILMAKRLGKELRCEISGQDLRVDERFSPILRNLVHMVRNAVDHGIELPEDRVNKTSEATINLNFSQQNGFFQIVVEDDGQGLHFEQIQSRGRALGLIKETDNLSEDELAKLILRPNFSTRTEITDISGRGVGMDAVREAVNELQGFIQIKSRRGLGTRIEIQLPLQEIHPISRIS